MLCSGHNFCPYTFFCVIVPSWAMPSLSTFNKDAKTCFYAYILVHSTVQMNIWQMELYQNCKVQEVPGYCLNVVTALFTVPFNSYSKSNCNPTYVLYNADLPSTPSTKRAYTIHFLILSTKRAVLIECNCTSCWDATTRTILSLVMSRGGFFRRPPTKMGMYGLLN